MRKENVIYAFFNHMFTIFKMTENFETEIKKKKKKIYIYIYKYQPRNFNDKASNKRTTNSE